MSEEARQEDGEASPPMVEAAIHALQTYRKEAGEAGWPEGALIIESFPAAIKQAVDAALAARPVTRAKGRSHERRPVSTDDG